jgi:hypothetical protein
MNIFVALQSDPFMSPFVLRVLLFAIPLYVAYIVYTLALAGEVFYAISLSVLLIVSCVFNYVVLPAKREQLRPVWKRWEYQIDCWLCRLFRLK